MGATMQPTAPNALKEYPDSSGMASGKMSENEAPAVPEGSQSGQKNPSIARSMSRYRRKRPDAPGNFSVPAIPRHATVPPTISQSSHTKQQLSEDEQARVRHRQNTIDQLTGGTRSNRSTSLPPTPAQAKDLGRKAPVYESANTDSYHQTDSSGGESTRKSLLQKVKLSKAKQTPVENKPVENKPRYIGVGGGGIVPGTDAPISAVNATGQRFVRVRYNDTTMDFAITPATQVQDLLLVASEFMSGDIDHEKFILLESFRQNGLQRPLRRYEHVREVMNSWAHDSASDMIIIPPSSIEALARLNIQQVPREQPSGTTVQLYYSQRARKWDKRYVTLRTDGQVFISKKENGKDATNICHMSDFDIYSPSPQALSKDIKPPKKICLAIKSQEKASMFLTTDKFVHFFATNDRSVADKWHQVVQEWRSWYVVHKLGAGKVVGLEAMLASQSLAQKKALVIDTDLDEATPEIGPLVTGLSAEEKEAATFAPAGLLGREYTQRRRAMREREEREKRAKQEAFSAQGLVSGSPKQYVAPHHQQGRINHGADSASLMSRRHAAGHQIKPLVDLTPVFHEAPQHTRKGRGVTVEAGLPLIEGATGPELAPGAVAIPPATAWRRPSAEPWQTRSRANTARSVRQASQSARSASSTSAGASPVSSSIPFPFVPNSLLAGSVRFPCQGQGQATTGHGVATGDRHATRPMLDMSPENPFEEGSLLHRL